MAMNCKNYKICDEVDAEYGDYKLKLKIWSICFQVQNLSSCFHCRVNQNGCYFVLFVHVIDA